MPIKTELNNVRLSGDIFNEYLNVSIAKPNAALPAPYRQSAIGPLVNNFSMSSLRTGQSLWTDSGAPNASVAESIGPYPTNLPYGTFSSTGPYTNWPNNTNTLLKQSTTNLKMSDYRGSFFPYYGSIRQTSYSDTTYTIGQGQFWLKFTCIGGGGGGGGGDGSQPARFGGQGGSGTQASMTCYVASTNANQAIRLFVGEGGYGGYTYQGGRNFWSAYDKPAGGGGWKTGGRGGRPLRLGGSGYGGGGGGASCIVWYPDGINAQGYILAFAGGGGGGGGAGQFTDNFEAGSFPAGILAGGYGVISSTTTYPRYTKNGGLAGIGSLDTGVNGFLVNRGDTADLNNTTTNGFDGIGADNFYSYYYKPYFEQTYGGVFSTFISERFSGFSDAQIDAQLTNFDTGGSGGGGGGGGVPGFLPAFYIYNYDDGVSSIYKELSFAQLEVGGGGGGSGWVYMSNTNIFNATSQFVWRNKGSSTLGWPSPRGPVNSNPQFAPNYTAGLGGTAGDGSGSKPDGGKGYDGAILLHITNAQHEGGFFELTTL